MWENPRGWTKEQAAKELADEFAADEETAKNLKNAMIKEIGSSRDHLETLESVKKSAKETGLSISYDGDHGEIIIVSDKYGKIGIDDRIQWD